MRACGYVLVALTAASAWAGNYSLEEFSHSFALPAGGSVEVENPNGDVRITAWDRDEVLVEGIKRGAGPEALDGTSVEVSAEGGRIAIRTRYDAPAGEPVTVEYRIHVPRRARLSNVMLSNGGLRLEGVEGGVHATAVNGTIHAENLAGAAELSTVNGKLEAGFSRLGCGEISLKSVNGAITLSLPSGVRASVEARNRAGGIHSFFGRPLHSAGAAGERLSARIKGGGTRIRLDNINGGISITPTATKL